MTRFLHLALFLIVAHSVAATVLPCKGPPPKCKDPNEEFILAKTGEPTCDNPAPKQCAPVSECRCKKGFVRHNGKCIKSCDCPAKCKDPNEVFILAKFGEPTCDAPTPKPCAPVSECRCKDGFVRYNGACIKPCDCPVKCKDPNEEYVLAKTGEPTCDNPNPLACTPVKECRCKSGFVRYKGICVQPTACPVKCKDVNEEYILAKFSEPSCDDPNPKPIAAIQECRCRSGWVRYNGRCILPCNCPAKCTGMFEEYVTATMSEPTCEKPNPTPVASVQQCRCIQGYVRNNGRCILPITCPCSDANEFYVIGSTISEASCADRIPKGIEPFTGCQCKGGFLRENGRCISPDDCPVICPDPNEEYVTALFSEMSCTDKVQRSISPVKQCRCKPGYLRDGVRCVLPSSCPVICPDPMEEYILVSKSEPSCSNPISVPITPTKECRCREGFLRDSGRCILPMLCPCEKANEEFMTTNLSEGTCADPTPKVDTQVTGCRCRAGFVRDNGACIPPSDCPPVCGEYQEYVLALFNEPTCNDNVVRTIIPVKECRCETGRVRHEGKCILQSECPVICKDANEEYVVCQYSEPTCTETIPRLIVTVQECRCKNGYVRDNGTCIMPNFCPVICTDPNEEHVTCMFSEPTCSEKIPKSIIPTQECRCKPNYVREGGKCILAGDCPVKCSDPNAEYVLSMYSEPSCDEPNPVAIAPIKECRCKSGYVKSGGVCISPADCPVKCPDPMLEEYVLTYLSEPTCSQPVPSTMTVAVKECRCKTGYFREGGKCILPIYCPVICSNENEEYILAMKGEKTCDDQNPAPCSPVNECRCKDGFVRYNGKCIPPCDCPAKCSDPNEEYVFSMYAERTCENPIPSGCSPVTECRCKDGFFRNGGICINPTSCPCGPNEVYSLTSPVEAETCTNMNKPNRCTDTRPGCMCIAGYVRDCQNRCIPKCDCPANSYPY